MKKIKDTYFGGEILPRGGFRGKIRTPAISGGMLLLSMYINLGGFFRK